MVQKSQCVIRIWMKQIILPIYIICYDRISKISFKICTKYIYMYAHWFIFWQHSIQNYYNYNYKHQ